MIADDHQLKLRGVLEEILAHESRRDFVAARQRLDLRLSPMPTLLCFMGADQARTTQTCEIGRMPVAVGGNERLHRRGGRVVAHNAGNAVDEDALAVCSGTITE